MNYLLDANSLSNDIFKKASDRNSLFVLQEVLDERVRFEEDINRIKSAGIKVLRITKKHLDKLMLVLEEYGDDFNLIRLYTGEGAADVLMVAYILAEQAAGEQSTRLFPTEWSMVTEDGELTAVARKYNIQSFSKSDLIARL